MHSDFSHFYKFYLLIVLDKDFGLFLTDDDPKKGVWLEPGRTLGYYMLRNNVSALVFVLFFVCLIAIMKVSCMAFLSKPCNHFSLSTQKDKKKELWDPSSASVFSFFSIIYIYNLT